MNLVPYGYIQVSLPCPWDQPAQPRGACRRMQSGSPTAPYIWARPGQARQQKAMWLCYPVFCDETYRTRHGRPPCPTANHREVGPWRDRLGPVMLFLWWICKWSLPSVIFGKLCGAAVASSRTAKLVYDAGCIRRGCAAVEEVSLCFM